jgi:hypothetical protein
MALTYNLAGLAVLCRVVVHGDNVAGEALVLGDVNFVND